MSPQEYFRYGFIPKKKLEEVICLGNKLGIKKKLLLTDIVLYTRIQNMLDTITA